jgi:GNAT superfamily N-acetyltransferase
MTLALAQFFPLGEEDVDAIERATVAAVAPDLLLETVGWLLPMDPGTIGRAHSAVPVSHAPDRQTALAAYMPDVARCYRDHGHRPVFRLPQHARQLQEAASALGAAPHEPTWVMSGRVAGLAEAFREPSPPARLVVAVADEPTEAWQSLFLGAGFDPVDGACRVRNLSRSRCNSYVTAFLDDEPVACGAASLAHGWLGVHGMRTAESQRGKGYAGQVLRTMATLAAQRGFDQVFLQVGERNTAALSLYARAGMRQAWAYAYWRVQG